MKNASHKLSIEIKHENLETIAKKNKMKKHRVIRKTY